MTVKKGKPVADATAITLTKAARADLSSQLAEGFHTAFRKASDHPNAHKIWLLIKELPSREWGNVISFVVDGVWRK